MELLGAHRTHLLLWWLAPLTIGLHYSEEMLWLLEVARSLWQLVALES